MAEASISVDQDQFVCPVCLNLLKDPVTIHSGHSFCKVCINGHWDQEDQKGVYSCPQCRDTFNPRPVLCRNNMLAEVVEKLKRKTEMSSCFCEHDVEACRSKNESEVKKEQMKSQQRIREKQKKVQELKQAVNTIKLSAQTAVEDSERIFTEMISSMEKKRSEVMEMIRAQEEAELSRNRRLLEQLEQEITDLQRRVTELSHPDIHFLQPLSVSFKHDDSPNISVHHHLSFDGVRNYLSDIKKQFFNKIPSYAVWMNLSSEPKTREDFLQHFCYLTLDPNTEHGYLRLCEKDRAVRRSKIDKSKPRHPERFNSIAQVLSKESVRGRSYWEVERSHDAVVYISVSYKGVNQKEPPRRTIFGYNDQSWSLSCSRSSLRFYHNDIKTEIGVSAPIKIGVYVDHSAGTLSFYSVSDTMKLLTPHSLSLYMLALLSGLLNQ